MIAVSGGFAALSVVLRHKLRSGNGLIPDHPNVGDLDRNRPEDFRRFPARRGRKIEPRRTDTFGYWLWVVQPRTIMYEDRLTIDDASLVVRQRRRY